LACPGRCTWQVGTPVFLIPFLGVQLPPRWSGSGGGYPALRCYLDQAAFVPRRLPYLGGYPAHVCYPASRCYPAPAVMLPCRLPCLVGHLSISRSPRRSGYPASAVTRPDGYPAGRLPGPTVTRPRHLPGQGRLPGVGGYPATAVTRPRPLCHPRAFHIRLDTTWVLDVCSVLVAGFSMFPGRRS
jgi:hypothetical protein